MEKRGYGWSVTLPVLLVLLAGLQTMTAQSCPPECRCTGTAAVTVTCRNRGLTSIPQLPPDVQRNVTTLDLPNNILTVLQPNALENYTSLRTLWLDNNQLTELPEGLLSATTQLRNLWLNRNQLTVLPDDLLTATTELHELDLINNQLTELPDGLLSATTQLQRLYLYNNRLTALPEGLLNATTQLELLDLVNNQLTELPDGLLSATTQLQRLDLNSNQLTALPEGLLNATTQLEELRLNNNQLTELPEGLLSTTTRLQFLFLEVNQLTELPEGLLSATTQLRGLYLHENQLTELPEGLLSATTQLRDLRLQYNQLTELPEGLLSATTQLDALWLHFNQLTELPEGLLNTTTQLLELYLHGNQLTVLPDGLLSATTQLRNLYLHDNRLTVLPEDLLSNITQLREVFVYNNPFHCDCELSWLPAFLRNVARTGNTPATCATPENLTGRDISTLPESLFDYCTATTTLVIITPSTVGTGSATTTPVIITPSPVGTEICPRESNTGFGLVWDITLPGIMAQQSCGANYTGVATRMCRSDATWAAPDVSQCENVAFVMLRENAEALFSNVTVVDNVTIAMALMFVSSLVTITQPTTISIFPRDLNTTNYVITNTVDLLIRNLDQGGATNISATTEVVEVVDNLLNPVNMAGFQTLQAVAPASQSVLSNAERYALFLADAMSQNSSEGGGINVSRGNIVIHAEGITVTSGTQPAGVTFPEEVELRNFITSGTSPPVINIPAQLLAERATSNTVSVANILFRSLQNFLPPEFNNSTAAPASLIISSQVAVQSGESTQSIVLQENPVTITFRVERGTHQEFSCVFWNFSDPIGSGGWSTEGVTTVEVAQDGNDTVVQCSSTHLTSFAVLVSVAGAPVYSLPLSIVSYIGLGISLACLLLTIIFFLSLGKQLFKAVHNFVHLNLAIALFVGYLTFAIGVELARTNKAACQAVTAIMQYFFLASFCWMLCEGIMLYLMLVVVFSDLSKKWWFFLLLGWIPPIIFVVIGLTTVLDEYVVYSRNETGILTDNAGYDSISFCWLSSGNGTYAIWTFVAPMLVVVLINSVFLVLVLVSVCRVRGKRMSQMKEKGKRVDIVVSLVMSSFILLPLLGMTWVLGLFAVNENTLVFAWLFTIFNSLQGMFIFFFHVLRSKRVWGRIKGKYLSTWSKGTATTSGGKKAGRVTNSIASDGRSTLEMKEKTGASVASATQFEPNGDTIEKPITDDDVAAVMISEARLSGEGPAEDKVTNSIASDGRSTLEMKEKTGASFASATQFEPNDDTIEKPITDDDVAAVMISEARISAEEPAEDKVDFSGDEVSLLIEGDEEEQVTVKEGTGLVGGVGINQQPHLLKMRRNDGGVTVRRKEFHTELLVHRNEQLMKRMESVLGVTLSGASAEPIRDDILLCRLMNKLHPGMISEEASASKRIHNVAEFVAACKKLKVPEHKLCTAGDIMEGKNMDSVIACLEYLLASESSSL